MSRSVCSFEVLLCCEVINTFVHVGKHLSNDHLICWVGDLISWLRPSVSVAPCRRGESQTFKARKKRCTMWVCVHVSGLCRSRGLSRVAILKTCTGPIMTGGDRCCCLVLTCRLRVPRSSASAPPGEKKAIPLPHLDLGTQSAGVLVFGT